MLLVRVLLALLLCGRKTESAQLDFDVPYKSIAHPLRIHPENNQFIIANAEGTIGVGDRLVGVNGEELSSLTLYEALQGAPNSSAILPLVEQEDSEGEGNHRLRGFVRIEVLDAESVVVRPMTEKRKELVTVLKKQQEAEEEARNKAASRRLAAQKAQAKAAAAKRAAAAEQKKQAATATAAKAAAAKAVAAKQALKRAAAAKAALAAKRAASGKGAAAEVAKSKAAAAMAAVQAKKKAIEQAKVKASAAVQKAGAATGDGAGGEPADPIAAAKQRAAEIKRKTEEAKALKKSAEEKKKRDDIAKAALAAKEKEEAIQNAKKEAIKKKMAAIETEKKINHQRRQMGESHWFSVTFSEPGSMGLALDAGTTFATVQHTMPGSPAARATPSLIKGDHLVMVNQKNVSTLNARQAMQVMSKAEWPRTLKFVRPESDASKLRKKQQAEHEKTFLPSPRLVLVKPSILAGSYNISLSNWGATTPKDCVPMDLEIGRTNEMAEAVSCDDPDDVDGVKKERPYNSSGSIHLVFRGRCSFIEKARAVQRWGGSATIVINTQDGPAYHMPAGEPTTADIISPVAMLDKVQGEVIVDLMEYASVKGWIETDGDCSSEIHNLAEEIGTMAPFQPWLSPPASNEGGTGIMLVWNPKTDVILVKVPFMKGEFGVALSVNPRRLYFPAKDHHACQIANIGERAANALVLAYRGTCSFGLKAKTLQSRRAQGMILINNREKGDLFPMQVNEEEEKILKIEAVTISAVSGAKLEKELEGDTILYARFL